MPLYEYICTTCDHRFEKLQSMNAAGADCPNCEQPAKRAISVFASVTKGGSDSGGQFASTRAAERMAEMLAEKEFNQVIVKYRGAGGNRSHSAPGATSAIRALTRAGVSITRIEDVTPVATDGTKSKGGRRGRRV